MERKIRCNNYFWFKEVIFYKEKTYKTDFNLQKNSIV